MERKIIYLAAGCFWGAQKYLDMLDGVLRIETDGEIIEAHAGDYVFWHRNCKATLRGVVFAGGVNDSGDEPRYVASPDINTEDFCAAVDFLATNEIRSAVLMIHGEQAHSCYFSRDAFDYMTSCKGERWAAYKELTIIPDAVHTELYDNLKIIPFDKIVDFYIANLNDFS